MIPFSLRKWSQTVLSSGRVSEKRRSVKSRLRLGSPQVGVESLEARALLSASDFGDAPAPYPVTLAEGGASHGPGTIFLGAQIDSEADGAHSANADGDDTTGTPDDEDGVTFGTLQAGALGSTVTVVVGGGAGKLDAWIDFNGDGNWGGAGEQIFASQAVVVGTNNLTFDVPSTAKDGQTFARFRLSTAGGLGPKSAAADGEVEDYAVAITPPKVASGDFSSQKVVSTAADGPASVSAADIDGDGKMDLVSGSFNDDKIAWYQNDGSQTFTAFTISTAANGVRSVTVADLDGDGDMDVLSASFFDGKIAWYENDGTPAVGAWTSRTITSSASVANSVTTADVDGDGDLDVLSASLGDNKIAWYENDGGQNFTTRVISLAAKGANSVAAADVDGDGDLDVLSASSFVDKYNPPAEYKVVWYENNGSQAFTARVISTAEKGANSVSAADIDGDGDLDVLGTSSYRSDFGDSDEDKVTWYENNGTETFTGHSFNAGRGVQSVFAADIEGDGDVDLLSASSSDNQITWYENDGSQNFASSSITSSASGARSATAADLDGDGDLDVVNAAYVGDKITWYENFRAERDFGDAPVPYRVTRAENGARHLFGGPTLGVGYDSDTMVVHSANADADGADDDGVTFGAIQVGALGCTVSVTVAGGGGKLDAWIDFNRDGNWDRTDEQIIGSRTVADGVNNFTFDVPSWALDGQSYARFRLSTAGDIGPVGLAMDGEVEDYVVTIGKPTASDALFNGQRLVNDAAVEPRSVDTADIDGDGDMDVVAATGTGGAFVWYDNDGQQGFTAKTLLSGLGITFYVVADDVDSDGDMDIVGSDAKLRWFENDGNQSFSVHEIASVSAYPVFTTADLDSDGDLDILAPVTGKIVWFENDGSQGFTERTLVYQNVVQDVTTSDVDTDGDLDILYAASNADKVAWLENDGSQSFTEHIITSALDSPVSVFPADMDRDGDMDILCGASNAHKVVWLENNGSESFVSHEVASGTQDIWRVVAADMNGDGDLDILSSKIFGTGISLYDNDGSQTFTTSVISTDSTNGNSFVVADMDRDGDIDVVNPGTNNGTIRWYENTKLPTGTLTATVSAGVLTLADIDGIGVNNDLTISVSGSNLIVTDANEKFQSAPAGGLLSDGNRTLTIALAGLTGIVNVDMAGGNDKVSVTSALSTLPAGLKLIGGVGADTFVLDADLALGSVTIDEVAGGVDTLDVSASSTAVSVNLGLSTLQVVNANLSLNLSAGNSVENVMGGAGNDTLRGNSLANTLTGNGGNDTLVGAGGNDEAIGGLGDDTYSFANATAAESDLITEASDEGTDTVSFQSVTTDVTVTLASASSQPVHTNRMLRIAAASAIENITGGSGNDSLRGNSLANTLRGNGGNDVLIGGAGNDSVIGGLGDDTYLFGIASSPESDTVTESASQGTDTLSFQSVSSSVTVSLLSSAFQSVHTNRMLKLVGSTAMENVAGGAGNDSIVGNDLANLLTGNGGNDSLAGRGGDDSLNGSAGDDTYVFAPATVAEADTVTESSGQGTDTLNFAALTSSVTVNMGTSAVQSVHVRRTLKLSSFVDVENVQGGSADDILSGSSANNVLTGNGGNDILIGNSGNDQLFGNAGRDILIGGLGLDTIDGGSEDDILIAGRTLHDTMTSNLIDVRTEWASVRDYPTRTGNVRAGVGASMTSLKTGMNVLNDLGDDDMLTGGSEQDWYFKAVDDVLTDLFAGEVIDVL